MLVVLAGAVGAGVAVDLAIGARPVGFGAGVAAFGVVILTVTARGLGMLLRRDLPRESAGEGDRA